MPISLPWEISSSARVKETTLCTLGIEKVLLYQKLKSRHFLFKTVFLKNLLKIAEKDEKVKEK